MSIVKSTFASEKSELWRSATIFSTDLPTFAGVLGTFISKIGFQINTHV